MICFNIIIQLLTHRVARPEMRIFGSSTIYVQDTMNLHDYFSVARVMDHQVGEMFTVLKNVEQQMVVQ